MIFSLLSAQRWRAPCSVQLPIFDGSQIKENGFRIQCCIHTGNLGMELSIKGSFEGDELSQIRKILKGCVEKGESFLGSFSHLISELHCLNCFPSKSLASDCVAVNVSHNISGSATLLQFIHVIIVEIMGQYKFSSMVQVRHFRRGVQITSNNVRVVQGSSLKTALDCESSTRTRKINCVDDGLCFLLEWTPQQPILGGMVWPGNSWFSTASEASVSRGRRLCATGCCWSPRL